MDCVVVSSLLGIVDQLQLLLLHNKNNPCLILPEIDLDDAQIILSTLKDKLHFLHAYLHKPNPIPISSNYPDLQAVERLNEEIRDVAKKAEDEIESKLGDVYQLQGEGECAVAVDAAAFEDLHRSLQQVVKDFESVEVQIRDLLMSSGTASIDDASSSFSSSTPPCLQLENVGDDFENTTIGVEGDVKQIKGMLIQTSSSTQLQVVSIVGMSGTGKTTLAQKVYGDPSIVSHFDIQAWTVEGPLLHSRRNLFIDILSCIVSLPKEEISKQEDDEQLAEQLRKLLMGQRYFIVIDDLWSIMAWVQLRTSFPDDRNGSRVLITTRYMGLATFASSSEFFL
ncbi:PREDICTED: putative disease resistance RPP13-like protein 3 isoform X4 [Ipomoea nil]|uniref:putative disease resistance RPP13-like protein 3 isoform X4 n=1 Tax=Ipomoea nil TaxID=35883 RepID=UPI0009012D77|nr:PREDICTED: putative disease resistance RPP13-like protein 3 isoform X4 [Ipomoea nil]